MASDCVACGESARTACRYCDRPVCAEHEPPGAHQCTGPRSTPATSPGPIGSDTTDPVRTGAWLLAGTVALAALIIVAVTLAPANATVGDGLEESRVAVHVAQFANEERAARGFHRLAWNDTLAGIASAHSTDMAHEGYFGHVGDGTVRQRFARAGLTCPGGENIYRTSAIASSYTERDLARRTVQAWLDSPGHRETLLGPRFTRQGVGVAIDRDGARTTLYVTQDVC